MLMTTLVKLTLMSLCVVSRRIDSLSLRSISQNWIENRCGTDLRSVPLAMRLSRYAGLTPGTGRSGLATAGPGASGPPAEGWDATNSLRSLWKPILPRKEVIQPHVPVRLPCYDFTPLTLHTFDASPLAVGPAASGADDSGGVTGGVYKARERIHRGMLIRDY